MAIETTLQPRHKWWNLFYAALCLLFALWGAYDYWVSIPAREAAANEYEQAVNTVSELQGKAQAAVQATQAAPGVGANITPDELARYEAANKVVEKYKGAAPQRPAAYDRPVQLWLYMVGCGVLGAPWFLWEWANAARKRYRLEDDGTLTAPEGTFPRDQIADIDMSRWMSKSLATVRLADGRTIVLDDYKFRDMHLIVGALAVRFYPDDWTEEARDRKRLRAKEALEAAAGPSGDGGPAGGPGAGADA